MLATVGGRIQTQEQIRENKTFYTAFDPNSDCYRQNVVIGSNGGKAKFTVDARSLRDRSDVGAYISMTDTYPGSIQLNNYPNDIVSSLKVDIQGSNANYGISYVAVDAQALDGKYAVSLKGESSSANGINIGCYSKVYNSNGGNIGVYTEAPNGPWDYAIQSIGALTSSQPQITLSDEAIKTDVEDIANATDILNQLQPKTYTNIEPEQRSLSLASGQQFGFLAQEVQEVLPSIVKEFNVLAEQDSTGFIEGTEMELLGIQYSQLISILVAGFQEQSGVVSEQQGIIQEQNEMIESLQETLQAQSDALSAMQAQMEEVQSQVALMQVKTNNCCTNSDGETMGAKSTTEGQELKLEQNVPNPFSEQTRIEFELPQESQVVLEITDQMGRPIERLIDGRMSQGVHSTAWDGSRLARGVYFYTLYADGKLVTKKMIKN